MAESKILHKASQFTVWDSDKKEQKESNIEFVMIKEVERTNKVEGEKDTFLGYSIKLVDGKWINGFMNEVAFEDNLKLKLLNPKDDKEKVNVGYEKTEGNKSYEKIYVKMPDGIYHSSFVSKQ